MRAGTGTADRGGRARGTSPRPGLLLMASAGWVPSSACADHERPLRDRNASVIGRRVVLLAGAALAARPTAAALPVPRSTALAFRAGPAWQRDRPAYRDLRIPGRQFDRPCLGGCAGNGVLHPDRPLLAPGGGNLAGRDPGRPDRRDPQERRCPVGQRTPHRRRPGSDRRQEQRYIAPEPTRSAPPTGTGTWWTGRSSAWRMGCCCGPRCSCTGAETMQLASGVAISADHYNLSGAFDVDVCYDRTDAWAGFALTAPDGSTVHDERL